MKPVEQVLGLWVQIQLEVPHGVAPVRQKRDLLVHLMALRVEHLEQAAFGLLVQGLHKPKALTGREILLSRSTNGQDAFPDDNFEVTLLLVPIAYISTIDAHRERPIGNR